MGLIPEYKSRAPLNRKANQALTSEAQLEEQRGQAISSTLGQASEVMFKAQMADEKIQRDTYLTNARLQLDANMSEHQNRIIQEYANRPEKAVDELQKVFKKEVGNLKKGAPFPRAAQDFMFDAENYNAKASDQIINWSYDQKIKNLVSAKDKMMDRQAVDSYRNPFDDQKYEEVQMAASMMADEFKDTMDPQLVDEKGYEYRRKAVGARFQGAFDLADRVLDLGPRKGETENDVIKRHNAIMNRVDKMVESNDFDYDLGESGLKYVRNNIRRLKKKAAAKAKDYSMLKLKNPYEYYKKINDPIPELDVLNPESAMMRSQVIAEREARDGIPLPFMSPLEEGLEIRRIERMSPQEQVNHIKKLSNLPDQEYLAVAKQLFRSKPEFVMAFDEVKNGGRNAEKNAADILAGSQLMTRNAETKQSSVVMPREKDMRGYFDQYVGNGITNPLERDAIYGAAKSILATKRNLGKASAWGPDVKAEDFSAEDKKIFKEAIESRIGEPYTQKNTKVFPIRKANGDFATKDETEFLVKNIRNDTLLETHGSKLYNPAGNTFDIDDAQKSLQFYMVGSGRYKVAYSDVVLRDKNGEDFIVDFNRLSQSKNLREKPSMGSRIMEGIMNILPSGDAGPK